MTDDLGPLRQAMSDLSEHGGSTDMYEGTLRRSRQARRRMAVTTGAATVVALALGGTVAVAVVNRPAPPAPVAVTPQYPGCPSIKTLEELVELPTGWSFASSEVECAESWAAAEVKRPTPGGNIYLFHYTTGTGWRYDDQGSGWKCTDLGLTEPAPFCTS